MEVYAVYLIYAQVAVRVVAVRCWKEETTTAMSRRVCYLAVGIVVCLLHPAPVRSQCTTKHCVGDDTDVSALTTMMYRMQDAQERQQNTLDILQNRITELEEALAKQQTSKYC